MNAAVSDPVPHPVAAPSAFRLVLPREHGSWSFALEPIALGLIAAPTWAGGGLALAVGAGFLARRPLKLACDAASASERNAARRATVAVTVVALVALATSAGLGGWRALWPLLLGAPFAGLFLFLDLRRQGREGVAEVAGATAFACVPAALAMLGGWSTAQALSLAALMLARTVPTVLTVRAYVRRRKGMAASPLPALAAAVGAVVGVAALVANGNAPQLAAVLVTLLLLRACFYLWPDATDATAKVIGIRESAIGAFYVLALGWAASH